MKKYLLHSISIALLLGSGQIVAQAISGQAFDLPSDYIRNNAQGNNEKLLNIEGSPYLTEAFQYGKVFINSNTYNENLRFNAYADAIEVKESTGGIIQLLKRDYIKAEISGEQYAIHPYEDNKSIRQGYFVELSPTDSSSVSLLHRRKKVLLPGEEVSSTYKKPAPPRLIDENGYFLKKHSAPAETIKLNAKSIFKALGDDGSLKDFTKKNKLNLKKEEDVVKLLQHYNAKNTNDF